MRPIARVRVLLVLDDQGRGAQLRQQVVRGRKHVPRALSVRIVQHVVDLGRNQAEQPSSIVSRDLHQVVNSVDRIVQRGVFAMPIACRQFPGLVAELSGASPQAMAQGDTTKLQRRLQMDTGLLADLSVQQDALRMDKASAAASLILASNPAAYWARKDALSNHSQAPAAAMVAAVTSTSSRWASRQLPNRMSQATRCNPARKSFAAELASKSCLKLLNSTGLSNSNSS